MKLIYWFMVGIANMALVVPSSVKALQYEIVELGTLGGSDSRAYGINDNGQVVGYSNLNNGRYQGFIWDSTNGMQALGPRPVDYTVAHDINNSGQVTGSFNEHIGALLWDSVNGLQEIDILNDTAGKHYIGREINDNGQVVGDSDGTGFSTAWIWDSSSGIQDIGTLGGSTASANAINNAGQVVGYSLDGGVNIRAFLWDSESGMINLGTKGGYSSSYAVDINNNGQVVGRLYSSDADLGFVWDSINGMQDFSFGNNTKGDVSAINDLGQVVGGSMGEIFVWDNVNGFQNNLLPQTTEWNQLVALDINNSGQIVGYGNLNGSGARAFLMTPVVVPEPASMLLIGSGLAALAGLRRKK